MKSKNIAISFVILTIGITWILWWGIVIANQYGYLTYGTPLMLVLYMIGGNTIPIIAIILLLKLKEMTGKELIRKIFGFKQPIRFYIFIIIAAVVSYVIPIVMDTSTITAPLYIALLSLPIMIVGGGLEEVGWRLILQPNLEKKMNFTFATLLTGVVWAIWHLPLFFMKGTNQYTWNFFAFAITVIGLSFILAAIYKISGSIWLCILFHAIWNALGESITTESNVLSSLVTTIVMIAVSYLVISLSKRNRKLEAVAMINHQLK
ncbi:CPBP family intramembrane metalloprotease [Paenibacillus sp. JCM 10914]